MPNYCGVVWNGRIGLSEYELWTNGVKVASVEELAGKVSSGF